MKKNKTKYGIEYNKYIFEGMIREVLSEEVTFSSLQ